MMDYLRVISLLFMSTVFAKDDYKNLVEKYFENEIELTGPLDKNVADKEQYFEQQGNVLKLIKFKLYNKAEILEFENIESDVIQRTSFNCTKLVVIVHGYQENADFWWVRDMANALINAEDLNVITVDWGELVDGFYRTAVSNINVAGSQIVDLLEDLIAGKLQKAENIHLIGFSLGAHLCGIVGKTMKDAGKEVSRITGLDPAGPQFEERDANDRLDAGHALFVDVIHTDTRLITTYGIFFLPDIIFSLGTNKRMGDSDFYPNDGYNQPGCELLSLADLLNPFESSAEKIEKISCSHLRAVAFYIESIQNKNAFKAKSCSNESIFLKQEKQGDQNCLPSANQMGYYTKQQPGVFYVKTKSSSPFSY